MNGPTTIRLAEVSPKEAQSVVIFRGHLRAANLTGRASFAMRCDVPGHRELLSHPGVVTGTIDSYVGRCTAEPGSGIQQIELSLVADGIGIVWVGPIVLFGEATR